MRTKAALFLAVAAIGLLCGCNEPFARGPYVLSIGEGQAEVLFRLQKGATLPPGTVMEVLDAAGDPLASAEPIKGRDGTYICFFCLGEPARAASYQLVAPDKPLCQPIALTLPRQEGPTRVIIYGDTRSIPADHAAVARAMGREKDVQAVFHVGDYVSDGTRAKSWDPEFFAPAVPFLAHSAFFPVIGNHEKRGAPFFEAFNTDPKGGYYARRIGRAHFVVVDQYQDYGPTSPQYSWLEKELNSIPAGAYKIVVMHEPLFSAYAKRGHSLKLIRGLGPLLDKAGVDLVFCGHDHHYVRSAVIGQETGQRGTTYVIAGGGGAPRYAPDPADWIKSATENLHYVVLDIAPTGCLSLSARDINGKEFDRFQIAAPGSQVAELAQGPMIAALLAKLELQKALESTFLIDKELAPGQAFFASIAIPLKNASTVPLEVDLAVQPGNWKADLSQSHFALAPGASAEAVVTVSYDGKKEIYPTPTLTCKWTLNRKAGEPMELALFLSTAPTGTLKRVDQAVTLDGMLTEKFWRTTPRLGYLLREDGKGLASGRTDMYVAAGPEALYFAAVCDEDQMEKVRAKAKAHDDPAVWSDDCIELFVEPVKGSGQYYQMVVSITGQRYEGKGKDGTWNAPWDAKVSKSQSNWTFEARIPWSSLGMSGRPGAGTKMGFNVGRTRNSVKELSQWSRIPSGDSHTPEKFGSLAAK